MRTLVCASSVNFSFMLSFERRTSSMVVVPSLSLSSSRQLLNLRTFAVASGSSTPLVVISTWRGSSPDVLLDVFEFFDDFVLLFYVSSEFVLISYSYSCSSSTTSSDLLNILGETQISLSTRQSIRLSIFFGMRLVRKPRISSKSCAPSLTSQ